MEAYCLKCKANVEMEDGEETTFKNGAKAMKGRCKVCGTKVCKILKR